MKLVQSIRLSGFSRLIQVARFSSSTESSPHDDMFDALETETEKDFGFDEWLKSTKAALAESKGKYWLGKNGPFPYNQSFAPRPVLSNAAKTKIFESFKQDPKTNDHRTLSSKFKVSIERIKAIIRQKELELELAQAGKAVDVSYIQQMESNLECVAVADDVRNAETPNSSLPVRPIFVNVPEGRGFDFNDAKATLLAMGINPKIPNTSNQQGQQEALATNLKVTEISKSEFERSRSKFVFVDTSKKDEIHIVVRDTDGTLRTPTKEELQSAVKKTWNRNAPKKLLK